MTFEKLYTLQDVFEEALVATSGGSTKDVVRWLQLNRAAVLEDNQLTIQCEGLGHLLRAYRKKRNGRDDDRDYVHNLCLDFGLPDLELPHEISVPNDITEVPYGPCTWPELDDATIDDLDKHMVLLDAQSEAVRAAKENIAILRQGAARIVPDRTDIPLRVLRSIAKERGQDL